MATNRPGAHLADLSWQAAARRMHDDLVILPFAAGAKEHGPHLPMGTDHLVLEHLLDVAISERPVLCAPPVLHGWFPAFRDYPGTEIRQVSVFQDYVRCVAESLIRHGARRLVILNTGISKATGLPLSIVARDLVADHKVNVLVLSWDDLGGGESGVELEQRRGGHADEGETSIVLHLRPDLVDLSDVDPEYRSAPVPQIGYLPGRFDPATEAGHYGDPTLADAEKGRVLLEHMSSRLLRALDQFAPRP